MKIVGRCLAILALLLVVALVSVVATLNVSAQEDPSFAVQQNETSASEVPKQRNPFGLNKSTSNWVG